MNGERSRFSEVEVVRVEDLGASEYRSLAALGRFACCKLTSGIGDITASVAADVGVGKKRLGDSLG